MKRSEFLRDKFSVTPDKRIIYFKAWSDDVLSKESLEATVKEYRANFSWAFCDLKDGDWITCGLIFLDDDFEKGLCTLVFIL